MQAFEKVNGLVAAFEAGNTMNMSNETLQAVATYKREIMEGTGSQVERTAAKRRLWERLFAASEV